MSLDNNSRGTHAEDAGDSCVRRKRKTSVIVFVCVKKQQQSLTQQDGGPGSGAGRCQLSDGDGKVQVHAGGTGQQEDYPAGSEVRTGKSWEHKRGNGEY